MYSLIGLFVRLSSLNWVIETTEHFGTYSKSLYGVSFGDQTYIYMDGNVDAILSLSIFTSGN